MTNRIEQVRRELVRLYRSEQGAVKIEYLLVIAAITLPLLAALIIYKNKLMSWMTDAWTHMVGNSNQSPGDPNPGLPASP